MYYCNNLILPQLQDTSRIPASSSTSTSLSSTADHVSASLNLLHEYNMTDDFIHGSHMHSDVQLSYPDESMNELTNEQYCDSADHNHSVQPVISQQSHHSIQPIISQQNHHSIQQPIISQQGHHSIQPVISQQSHLQSKEQQVVASVVMQEDERRLPEPCPVPYNSFSQDLIEAIDKGQIKGLFKTRLIRQAADFYHGMCPHPNHIEYVDMAKTLCHKYPQLHDKKPVKGKFIYYVSIIKLVWHTYITEHYEYFVSL